MVDFIRKRLQVFVSSTFSDLHEERQAAVEAILSAGHIPAGMELFAAGDESQMEVIKQWINESDVYLLILGGRYGSVEPKSGKSYIHLEYEYALAQRKPVFACVIKDAALEARVKRHGMEMIDNYRKEWGAFRDLVQTKMVEFWEDSKDIALSIVKKLGELARREDLVGWMRTHQEANLPALSNEIVRLSKENADLRSQLGAKSEVLISGLSYSDLRNVLQKRGILNFIKSSKDKLREGIGIGESPDEIKALMQLGLMVRLSQLSHFVTPTEAGRIFLNKIELEELTAPTVRPRRR